MDRSPALHASPARLLGTTSNLDPRATGQGRRNGGHRGRQEGVEVVEDGGRKGSEMDRGMVVAMVVAMVVTQRSSGAGGKYRSEDGGRNGSANGDSEGGW